MTATLTPSGYKQTKAKLAKLEERLARLDDVSGISAKHVFEARRSYEKLISQYRREIKFTNRRIRNRQQRSSPIK